MTGKLHLHNHYNGLKTAVLFAIMWAIIMIIWWATGARTSTLGIYLAIGVGTSFISYWFSDKLAIASMHAQPVTEQQAPELYRIVRELSQRAGKPMPRIYIAPTETPNAFATGRNENHAAVCCTQGILRILDEREIRGVLGHELMHVYNRDIRTSAIAGAMATVLTYLGYSMMYIGNSSSSNRDRDNGAGLLGLIGILLSTVLAPIAASLIQMAISRTREYDADEDGSELTGDPLALASAQDLRWRGCQSAAEDEHRHLHRRDDDRVAVPWCRRFQIVLHAPADRGPHRAPEPDGRRHGADRSRCRFAAGCGLRSVFAVPPALSLHGCGHPCGRGARLCRIYGRLSKVRRRGHALRM